MFSQPNLSVIIVNYNSANALNRCIASLAHVSEPSIEYIIINNSSDILTNLPENARLLQNTHNIGFGSAANQGARVAAAPFLLFLNPDTEWHSGDIQNTLKYFKYNRQIALLGSQLLSPNGKPQPWSCGAEVTVSDIVRNNLFEPKSKPLWESNRFRQDVAWVSGGALFARAEDFFAIGGFDTNFFLYFEDVDLCRRMRQRSKVIAFDPEMRFTHTGGESFAHDIREQKKHYYQSQSYYIRKHFGAHKAWLLKFLRLLEGR